MKYKPFGNDLLAQTKDYLPSNYSAVPALKLGGLGTRGEDKTTILIVGHDNAGWTLDGYVLPRLGTTGIHAVEISRPSVLLDSFHTL
jgi:hypothetical protein